MPLLDRFLASSLDATDIGLAAPAPETSVPDGMMPVAVQAESGVCFCCLCGDKARIFQIDLDAPASAPVVVAESFADFLGLVVACRGAYAIAQARYESRACFEETHASAALSAKQRAILRAIQNGFHPPVISDPFSYLLAAEAADVPELSRFLAFPESDAPSRIKPLDKLLSWGGLDWRIPAVALGTEGVAFDLIASLPPSAAYFPFSLRAELNGRRVPSGVTFVRWDAHVQNSAEALAFLRAYARDREQTWLFVRATFPWVRKPHTALRTIRLTFSAEQQPAGALNLYAPAPGESTAFQNPLTGETHTFTTVSMTKAVCDFELLTEEPCQYWQLCYRVSPALSAEEMTVLDTAASDPLRCVPGAGAIGVIDSSDTAGAVGSSNLVGVIGGTDGPTVCFSAPPEAAHGVRTACSALHYKIPAAVLWKLQFWKKPAADQSVLLHI